MPIHARAERLARGWTVGLVATTVAAVSHSLAGGYQPGILSFGVALVFAGFVGTALMRSTLGGRGPSLPRLIATVSISQLAFHLVFSMLGSGNAAPSPGAGSGTGMSGMAGMQDAAPATMIMSGHDHLTDPSMWLAHAIAAALTILFLRHAELQLWGMLTRVLERVFFDSIPVVPVRALFHDRRVELPLVRRLASRLLVFSASRRGPPPLSF